KAFYQEEKKSMEERIQTLEVCEKEIMTIREDHMADMAKQKELIDEAHSNYQKELLNHSKDIEALYKIKDQLKELESEVSQYKTKATNANLLLKKNEILWNNEKETLNGTIKRLETRCDDLGKQNNILQEQYIQLNKQIQKTNEIEKGMESLDANDAKINQLDESTQKKIDDLNEVIIFLRNEKEIAICEKDILEQKTVGFKQQIDDLKASLDRTKILLSEEKKSKESEYLQSKKENEMLSKKVSELNVYLESNERLRKQNNLSEQKLEKLKNEHSNLMKKLEPLNKELKSIKAELGVKNKEIETLENDNKNWKNRVNSILTKYEKIDPVEFKQIKEDNEKLKREKQEFEIQKQKLVTLEKEIAKSNSERDGLKAKINDLSTKQAKLSEILKSQRQLLNNQKTELHKKEEEHKKAINELNEKHK
ncbi:TPR/MLP1/MLP2-like protein-domain-containing protein, partial [Neocallimastix lanati (nom. inval.)]